MHSAMPCSVSPLTSCIHSCLFSDWKRTASSKFFGTQVSSPVSTVKLVLPRHACCALSCLFSNGRSPTVEFLSHKNWQNRESFMQRLADVRPGHLSSHSALSSYGLFASLALWPSLSLNVIWSRIWGVARILGLDGLPPRPHSSEGVGQQQQHGVAIRFM